MDIFDGSFITMGAEANRIVNTCQVYAWTFAASTLGGIPAVYYLFVLFMFMFMSVRSMRHNTHFQ